MMSCSNVNDMFEYGVFEYVYIRIPLICSNVNDMVENVYVQILLTCSNMFIFECQDANLRS